MGFVPELMQLTFKVSVVCLSLCSEFSSFVLCASGLSVCMFTDGQRWTRAEFGLPRLCKEHSFFPANDSSKLAFSVRQQQVSEPQSSQLFSFVNHNSYNSYFPSKRVSPGAPFPEYLNLAHSIVEMEVRASHLLTALSVKMVVRCAHVCTFVVCVSFV